MRWFIGLLTVLLLLLQYRLWVGEGSLADVWRLRQAVALQEQENESLDQRNRVLAAEVIDLKKGTEAIEERARQDLGMIREGEIFFQVVESPPSGSADNGR